MYISFLQNISMCLPHVALGLLLSLTFTYFAIKLLPHFGYIDIPGGRRQHEKPVPRGGGVAVWLAFFVTVALLTVSLKPINMQWFLVTKTFLLRFLPPAAIILIIGMIDDRVELKSYVKLLGQIIAASVIYFQGTAVYLIFHCHLPAYLSYAVTVFWCVIIINAFNLIDGLDGIAAGLSAISSFLLAIWGIIYGANIAMAAIMLIFSGCCLGFLRYNFSPARIFMGDTGSMFLGLFFAYVSIHTSTKNITLTSLLVPVAAMGVPIFDVFLAIWRRFFRRFVQKNPESSIMSGDHDHLHHRIQKETGTTRKTAYTMYLLSLAICTAAIFFTLFRNKIPALSFILCLLVLFVTIRYAGIELYDTLTSVAKGLQKPHRNFLLSAIHPVLDILLLLTAFILSNHICDSFLHNNKSTLWMISHIAPFVICFCISGIYRTFWLRVGIIQYYRLAKLLIIAGIVGYICNSIFCIYFKIPKAEIFKYGTFYAVYFMLLSLLIVCERFWINFYASFGYRRLLIRNQGKNSSFNRVMIYGGGVFCRLYVTKLFCSFKVNDEPVKIVGILDDNPALKNHNVYGFKVLGTSRELEQIFQKTKFDTLLVACESSELDKLKEFCKNNSIRMKTMVCREEDII